MWKLKLKDTLQQYDDNKYFILGNTRVDPYLKYTGPMGPEPWAPRATGPQAPMWIQKAHGLQEATLGFKNGRPGDMDCEKLVCKLSPLIWGGILTFWIMLFFKQFASFQKR